MSTSGNGSGMTPTRVLRRNIHKLGYRVAGKGSVLSHYKEFMETQRWPYDRLLELQEEQLRRLTHFVYENISYFAHLFDSTGLRPSDIHGIQDLQKLPILTKKLIRDYQAEMLPKNISALEYALGSTGGSTGDPLKYRMSIEDRDRGVALLYRGWGSGGYQLGDKLAVIAGSSLIPSARSAIRKRLQGYVLNTHFYSSFGMDEETMLRYLRHLNRVKPRFIRGYASAIYFVAKSIRDTSFRLSFQPTAVFTTAEKLLDGQRELIEGAFKSEVFDNYGLNDGGVSAYECREHRGMHVDMERAVLEVVDEEGNQIIGEPGRILATSLYNYAFPFIRYDTGDIGTVVDSTCPCGRQTPLLVNVLGRVTELLTINGRVIGSPVLTVLFGKCDIEQYQIVQESDDTLTCRIVKGRSYTERDEHFIRESLLNHVGQATILFEYKESISPIDGNKHKFIVNRSRDDSQSM